MNDRKIIYADDAINAIERNAYRHTYLDQIINIISNLPSAQPERKKGEWIKHKDGYYRCSECGSRGSAIKAHYCHHCGADMRGEEDE